MLYIISGPSSVGKSIIVKLFIEKNGFNRVVPFTSRERRIHENEIEGKEYFFREKVELWKISKNFTLGYWDFPFGHVYGYTSDIKDAISSKHNHIILATTKIALAIKNDHRNVTICFIDFKTNEELEKRITDRFKPNMNFIKEKLLNAITERKNKNNFDIKLEDDNAFRLYDELAKFISPLKQ